MTGAILIPIGYAAGLFGSLLGLGGGWLMVPALSMTGLAARTCVGTSLVAMVINTLISIVRYRRKGRLNIMTGLCFGAPALIGLEAGQRILAWAAASGFGDAMLRGLFVALLGLLALSMLRNSRKTVSGHPSPETHPGSLLRHILHAGPALSVPGTDRTVALTAAVGGGFVAGTVSGIMGIGGGLILVPLLTGLYGLTMLQAVSISLVSVMTSATFGAVRFSMLGEVAWLDAFWLVIGSTLGALHGTTLATRATELQLKRSFAFLAGLVAASIAVLVWQPGPGASWLLFAGTAVQTILFLAGIYGRDRAAKQKTGELTP